MWLMRRDQPRNGVISYKMVGFPFPNWDTTTIPQPTMNQTKQMGKKEKRKYGSTIIYVFLLFSFSLLFSVCAFLKLISENDLNKTLIYDTSLGACESN